MALPTSYRKSEGENRCDNCGYFNAESLFCSKWDATVEADYLCDSWKPIEVKEDPVPSEEEKKRGGVLRYRTIKLPNGKYARVAVVPKAGPKGGHTVIGKIKRKKKG